MKKIPFILLAGLISSISAHATTLIYEEDFSNATLNSNGNPYLGGWYSNQIGFEEFTGSSSDTSITNSDTLKVSSSSTHRSAAIILGPDSFANGSGLYTLSFDIVSFEGPSGDSATVSIWQGSGYDLDENSADALILDTYNEMLKSQGNATASMTSRSEHTSPVTDYRQTFFYDGTSAVALFFGVENDGSWPFPTAEYDNISITQGFGAATPPPIAVPEPSSLALLGLSSLFLITRRRR
ncbi:PEP-CTERM sorting domain-containing protein [Rubritalea spongiae]|uniref:PEP-CTERM sorting domain-containing protein n=1 Tax=Rubritalea spongiae TaxID=430797 RepID=A0ABW5E4Y8_9BACT